MLSSLVRPSGFSRCLSDGRRAPPDQGLARAWGASDPKTTTARGASLGESVSDLEPYPADLSPAAVELHDVVGSGLGIARASARGYESE